MRRRKYVGDGDLRESENSRTNPREAFEDQKIRAKELVAIHGTIELRNDDDSLELFDQRDESNQDIQAQFNVNHSAECLNLESPNLMPGDPVKLIRSKLTCTGSLLASYGTSGTFCDCVGRRDSCRSNAHDCLSRGTGRQPGSKSA